MQSDREAQTPTLLINPLHHGRTLLPVFRPGYMRRFRKSGITGLEKQPAKDEYGLVLERVFFLPHFSEFSQRKKASAPACDSRPLGQLKK